MSGPRVLLISSNSSGRGGGERYLVFLAQGLCELGIEVHALISSQAYMDGWAKDLSGAGAIVRRRALKGLSQRPLRFVQSVTDTAQQRAVAEVCVDVAPDAIVVNQQYDEDGLDYLSGALQSGSAPVVGVMHMPMTASKNDRPLGRLRGWFLSHWYARHPYKLVLVSQGAQAEFEACYPRPRPTYVINNGIPLEAELAKASAPLNRSGEEPVIGFVGQFVAQKNLHTLVQTWLALRQSGLACRLLLVGDGPDRAALERQLAASAPAGSWQITGWMNQPESMLSKMDVFVLCSHFEGLPLSLVEAAARGVPCVVTPFNGASDVASKAHWVRVAADHSPAALMQVMKEALGAQGQTASANPSELATFRGYFSIRRMATDMAALMGVRGQGCTS